jgi:hypothetical protein
MPIAGTDIEFRYSGGTTNTSALASLGGAMSTQAGAAFATAVANNLWDDVTGAQSAAGAIEHRAIYVKNNHATITWQSVVFWIDVQVATDAAHDTVDVALASEAVNVAIVQTLGSETSVPTGVTFTTPTTKAGGLVIGNIPATQFKGLWTRRNISAGAVAAAAAPSIRCEGDTGP